MLSGVGQDKLTGYNGGELIVQTPYAGFALVYAGTTDPDGNPAVPEGQDGWYLIRSNKCLLSRIKDDKRCRYWHHYAMDRGIMYSSGWFSQWMIVVADFPFRPHWPYNAILEVLKQKQPLIR